MMGRLENDDMQVANGILEDISRALAAGLSNFINLLNPETVYFGGRVVVEFPQPVRDSIQRATAKRSAGFLSSIKFVESRVDDELLIKGSVYRFLDEHIGLLMPMSL
jgi:predicted NBD/HSP70 family sugar kinase